MNISEFLGRLDKVRKTGDKYQAVCPGHDDKSPSLSVKEGREGILVYCHAGCTTSDITGALGLQLRDLFYESRPIRSSSGLSRTQLETSLETEALIILICLNRRKDFLPITDTDRVRERLAAQRFCKIARELYV